MGYNLRTMVTITAPKIALLPCSLLWSTVVSYLAWKFYSVPSTGVGEIGVAGQWVKNPGWVIYTFRYLFFKNLLIDWL